MTIQLCFQTVAMDDVTTSLHYGGSSQQHIYSSPGDFPERSFYGCITFTQCSLIISDNVSIQELSMLSNTLGDTGTMIRRSN